MSNKYTHQPISTQYPGYYTQYPVYYNQYPVYYTQYPVYYNQYPVYNNQSVYNLMKLRMNMLNSELLRLKPDILCFQEMSNESLMISSSVK